MYSNLRLQYFGEQQTIDDIQVRTISKDGSVYPFDGRYSSERVVQGHSQRRHGDSELDVFGNEFRLQLLGK